MQTKCVVSLQLYNTTRFFSILFKTIIISPQRLRERDIYTQQGSRAFELQPLTIYECCYLEVDGEAVIQINLG